jgi:hypothetical protein
LGTLLGDDKIAGKTAEGAAPSMVTPGVGSLLRGQPPQGAPLMGRFSIRRVVALPDWYFYSADLLLIVSAGLVVYTGPRPLGWSQIAFCAVAVGLGAVLSLIPFLGKREALMSRDPREPLPRWLLSKSAETGPDREFVIHLHAPNLVAEVFGQQDGPPTVRPLWVDGTKGVAQEEMERLVEEAAIFVQTQRRGERS